MLVPPVGCLPRRVRPSGARRAYAPDEWVSMNRARPHDLLHEAGGLQILQEVGVDELGRLAAGQARLVGGQVVQQPADACLADVGRKESGY